MFATQPTHFRLMKSEFVSPANNVLSERSKKKGGGLAGEELLAEPVGRRVRVARVLLPARALFVPLQLGQLLLSVLGCLRALLGVIR